MTTYNELFHFGKVTRVWVAVLTIFGLSSLYRTRSLLYKVSYVKVSYSILLATVLTFILYHEQNIYSHPKAKDIKTSFIRIFIFSSGNITSVLLILLSVTNAAPGADLLSTLVNFSKKYGLNVFLSIKFFSAFLACGIVTLINLITDFVQFFTFYETSIFLKYLFFGYLFPIYSFLTVGQFSFQMRLFQTHLKMLNDRLRNFESKEISYTFRMTLEVSAVCAVMKILVKVK